MRKYDGIPELMEQFMREEATDELWVTVQEVRNRFGLTRYQGNTVSGFLRRLHSGPFRQYPYVVLRVDHVAGHRPSDPLKYRYLVRKKAGSNDTVTIPVQDTQMPA